jgi:hypothetical protein
MGTFRYMQQCCCCRVASRHVDYYCMYVSCKARWTTEPWTGSGYVVSKKTKSEERQIVCHGSWVMGTGPQFWNAFYLDLLSISPAWKAPFVSSLDLCIQAQAPPCLASNMRRPSCRTTQKDSDIVFFFFLTNVFVVFHFKYTRHLERLNKQSAKHVSTFHKNI